MGKYLTAIIICAGVFRSFGQDAIEGTWLAAEGKTKVEIYKEDASHMEGKIVWIKQETDKNGNLPTDRKNPDKALRDRPILGLTMLTDIEYREGKWYGMIYAPRHGRTLPVELSLEGENKLNLDVTFRGITRGQTWVRAEEITE